MHGAAELTRVAAVGVGGRLWSEEGCRVSVVLGSPVTPRVGALSAGVVLPAFKP